MTSQTFNIPVCFPHGQQFLLLRYLFGCCFYSFHAEAVLYKETQKPDNLVIYKKDVYIAIENYSTGNSNKTYFPSFVSCISMLVSGNKLSSSSSSSRVATPSTAELGGFSSSPSSLGMLSSSSPSASYIKFQILYHWIVTRYIWVKKNAYCVNSLCDGVRLSKANKQDKSKTKHGYRKTKHLWKPLGPYLN